MTCTESGAWVESGDAGTPLLKLVPAVKYHIVSWQNQVLTAQHDFGDSEAILTITIGDSIATRYRHGTGAWKTDLDSSAWLEEVLR
jgi:hypothetical protein